MIKTEEQKSSLPKFNDIKSKVTDKSLEDILEYVYIRLLGDDKTAHHSLLSLYSEVYHLENNGFVSTGSDGKEYVSAYNKHFQKNHFSAIIYYDTRLNTFLAGSEGNMGFNSLFTIPLLFNKPKYKKVIEDIFEITAYNITNKVLLCADKMEDLENVKPYLKFKMVSLDEFKKAILPVFKKDFSLLLKNRYSKLVKNMLDTSSQATNVRLIEIINNNYTETEFQELTINEKCDSILEMLIQTKSYTFESFMTYDELNYMINHLIGDDYSLILNTLANDQSDRFSSIKYATETLIAEILCQKETLTDLDKDTILNSYLGKLSLDSLVKDINDNVIFRGMFIQTQRHNKLYFLQLKILGVDKFITLIDDECKTRVLDNPNPIASKLNYIVSLIIGINSSWSAHKNNLNFDFDMSEQHLYKYVFSILEKNK